MVEVQNSTQLKTKLWKWVECEVIMCEIRKKEYRCRIRDDKGQLR